MKPQIIRFQSRAEWLDLRRQDITASDAAAIAGVSPHKSALQVWAEKSGAIPERPSTDLMRRGRWLEPAVVAALVEEYPAWTVQYPLHVYYRLDGERIGATPDAFADDVRGRGVVQCKVVSAPIFEQEWSDGPPLHYEIQALVEAMVTGSKWAAIAALVVDTFNATLRVFPVGLSDEAWARIVFQVRQFWLDVEQGKEPGVDYQRDGELLKMLHKPDALKPVLDLMGDNRANELCRARESIAGQRAQLDADWESVNAELVDKLRGHPAAICNGFKITNKLTHRAGYEVGPKSFSVLRTARYEPPPSEPE